MTCPFNTCYTFVYMLFYCVCVENTNISYNPKLLLEFRKLWVWLSCLEQHFNYSLKWLLNWRPEQHRAAGLEKEFNVCTLHRFHFIVIFTNKYIYYAFVILHIKLCKMYGTWIKTLPLIAESKKQNFEQPCS